MVSTWDTGTAKYLIEVRLGCLKFSTNPGMTVNDFISHNESGRHTCFQETNSTTNTCRKIVFINNYPDKELTSLPG